MYHSVTDWITAITFILQSKSQFLFYLLIGTLYPNIPSFSANCNYYLPSRVIPKVLARTWCRTVYDLHAPAAAYQQWSLIANRHPQDLPGSPLLQEEEAGIYDVHSSIWCRKRSWSRHQKCKRRRREFIMFTLLFSLFYFIYDVHSSIWCHKRSWSWHQNLWEGKGWYFIIVPANLQLSPTLQPYYVVSWVDSEITKPDAMRCHSTRN